MVASLLRTCSISRKTGLSSGTRSSRRICARPAADMPKNCSAAWLTWRKWFSGSSSITGIGKALRMAAVSTGRTRLAAGRSARVITLLMRPPRHAVVAGRGVIGRRGAGDAAGDQRIIKRVDQAQDWLGVGEAVHGGTELGGARQAARVPGNVLAGEADAGTGAELAEHQGIVFQQDGFLLRQRQVGQS